MKKIVNDQQTQLSTLEFLTFTLGDEYYGLDIMQVKEIRGYEPVTKIANAPAFIKGVLNLRGDIVPIVDLRLKFSVSTATYDEFTIVIMLHIDERIVGKKPESLSFAEAAAMPLTTITAWEALFDRMAISRDAMRNAGRSILIIGGAGGVGSIAIQLAKLAGLKVIATASRPNSNQWCLDMGADAVINHHKSFIDELKENGQSGVDYIFCTAGTAQHWHGMVDVINPQGKICLIVDSESNQPLNINLLKAKSVTVVWEFMFTRARFQTADMAAQGVLLNEAADLLDSGKLRHTMTEHLQPVNATNLKQAHAKMESATMLGKLVLSGF